MRLFFFLFVLARSCLGFCTLPSDDDVVCGKLENGLTYYIRENSFPKQKAALRLVVKVGSIYEKDEEKGIAHFIEHLVFRGSKHFPDGEIFQYLESIGCWAGADANAYTSYDSTLYQLDIPLDKDHSLETALTILADVASGATLTDDSIEKERNVVLDELYHDVSSPNSRISDKLISSFIPSSPYLNHAPIGLEKVIQKVSSSTLRNFYNRWYRPDRMAVIAVGDFKSASMEKKIEEYFSPLPCPEETVKEPSMDVQYNENAQTVIHYDPDLSITQIVLLSLYPSEKEMASEEQIKREFLSSVSTQMLQHRLAKLEHEGTAFLGTDADTGSFVGKIHYSYIEAELLEMSYKEGLKLINQELQKVLDYGFTNSEWLKIQNRWKGKFKRNCANAEKVEHQYYLEDYISHFLKNTPLISPNWYSNYMNNLVDTLTIEEINAFLPYSHLADPFNIFLATSSMEIQNTLGKGDLLELLTEKDPDLSPEEEDCDVLSFESFPKFPKGTISSVQNDELVTRWSLSNGIELVLKKTDLEQERIHIFAQAKGGLAALPEEYLQSGSFALEYAIFSGLNGLSYYELSEFLRSQGVHFSLKLVGGIRTFHLSIDRDQIELLFQLIHEFFTDHPFNQHEWEILTAKTEEVEKADHKDSAFLFEHFVSQTNSQNYFYFHPLDSKKADEATARKIFDYFFGSPQDFTFVIVGDFDEAEIAELTEDYIASLPVSEKEPLPDTNIPWLFPQGVVYKEFKHGHNAYTTTVISLPYDYDALFKQFGNTYSFNALSKILEQRLQIALRKKLGTTYGVSVNSLEPFYPDFHHAHLQIEFTSQSTHRKKMTDLILHEIATLKNSLPSKQEVATVQTLFLESKKQEALSNGFWINALHFSLTHDLQLKHVIAFEEHIADLSPEKIQKAAQIVFAHPYYTVISHLPED